MTKRKDMRESMRQRIYSRGRQGRYYIDLRDLGGDREALIPPGSTYATNDEVVAIDLAGKRIAELEAKKRGVYFGDLKRTTSLGEFAREWLAYRRSLSALDGYAGKRTIDRYEQALKNFFAVVEQDTRIDRFTKGDVKKAIAKLAQQPSRSGGTLKSASLKQVYITMRLIFEHAKDEGVVSPDHNPWSALGSAERPKLRKTSTTDFLEVYEAAMLLAACPRVSGCRLPLREIVATYLLSGGRKSEVLGLELADVDLTRKLIHFRPNRWRDIKTKERRTVPLWPQLEEILQPYIARHQHRTGLLFPSEDSDLKRQIMISAPNKPLKLARDIAADLLGGERGNALRAKEVTPRALRPTYCAARLQTLDNGKPIATWTARCEMGHSSMKMIDDVYGRLGRYRHRSEDVEYRLDASDAGRADDSPVRASMRGNQRVTPTWSATDGGAPTHVGDDEATRSSPETNDDMPELPVTDSFRPGRIRFAQFLSEAGISKNTFALRYRRDAAWMQRLDVHRDHGDRLHFPERAGHELRASRNKKPHGNKGRASGRICTGCAGRVHVRLTKCASCGTPTSKGHDLATHAVREPSELLTA